MITINGYLNQTKLESALQELVGATNWLGRELRVPDSKRRWDMAYCIEGHTTIVEFDGDQHYCNSLKIKVDGEKDAVAFSHGYSVVRIPYWVQLTNETALHYFGIKTQIEQDFLHGFITTKIFPASFSEMGVARFLRELLALPESTKNAVITSLRNRAQDYGIEFVLPTSLRSLI